MDVVAFSSGSLVSLFPLEAFIPLGGLNEQKVIDATSQRYHFSKTPNLSVSRAELEQTGIVFELGFLETEVEEVTIDRLSIYNDGMVVRANKTEHAETFFNDVAEWLIKDYGCRQVRRKPHYVSEIVVDFERPAANVLNNYEKIANILLSNVNENREATAVAFNAFSIEFVTKSKSAAMPKFVIERREGTSVENERYFCSAPLTTERHLQVLEEIERLFL